MDNLELSKYCYENDITFNNHSLDDFDSQDDVVQAMMVGFGKMYENSLSNNAEQNRLNKLIRESNTENKHEMLDVIDGYFNQFTKSEVDSQLIVIKGAQIDSTKFKEGIAVKRAPYRNNVYTFNIFWHKVSKDMFDKSIEGEQFGTIIRTNKFLTQNQLIELVCTLNNTEYKMTKFDDFGVKKVYKI